MFDAAYGVSSGIEASSRLSGLRSVARALDSGDLPLAAMSSLMLRLPEISGAGMERLAKLETTRKANFNPDQARDRNGEWTSGGSAMSDDARATVSRPGPRGLPLPRGNRNLIPAQGAVPFPVPFGGAAPAGGISPGRKDDDFVYPPTPDLGVKPAANDNAGAQTRAANDNGPKVCPDPSYEWSSVGRKPETLLYQAQITGLPLGWHVMFNGVGYDGCQTEPNAFLEAKYNESDWLINIPINKGRRTLDGYFKIMDQAAAQDNYSGGRPVEWHFANEKMADFFREEFKNAHYNNITVYYTPFDRNFKPILEKYIYSNLICDTYYNFFNIYGVG